MSAADHPARGVDPDVLFAFVDRDGDRLEVRVGEEPGGAVNTFSNEARTWTGVNLPSAVMNVQGLINAILEATGMRLRIDPDTDAITVARLP